ncbi:MAG TPA: hypothetical protein VFK02_23180 [Kofleriaceae bacterium]|nr:hypothetical protein [Kofleriaceae bacterium]
MCDPAGRSTSSSRWPTALVALAVWAGCGPGAPSRPPPAAPGDGSHSTLAEDDDDRPAYGKPELQKALIDERGLEATGERQIADLEARQDDTPSAGLAALEDQLRVAAADLAVRRRFIATLEACEASGRLCPPRLDDPPWAFDPDPDRPVPPPMTAPLRFDLDSWRALAAELHGRACACRTIACVDSVGVAIDQLEVRPMPEVQGDDAASVSVTRARECLFRLRGKARLARPPAPAED